MATRVNARKTANARRAQEDPTAEAAVEAPVKTVTPNGGSRSLLEIAQTYSAPGIAVHIRIEGLPPGLLMHNGEAMKLAEEAADKHRKDGNRSKYIPAADVEATWGLYRFDDETLYLPCGNLLRCFTEAAKAFKLPKSRATMWKAAAAGITIPATVGAGYPLLWPTTDTPLRAFAGGEIGYEINTQRAVVQKQAIRRSRPLLKEWAVEADFLLDVDAVPLTVFAEIVGYAGSRIGVCDKRPEKGGQNGRFSVVQLELG